MSYIIFTETEIKKVSYFLYKAFSIVDGENLKVVFTSSVVKCLVTYNNIFYTILIVITSKRVIRSITHGEYLVNASNIFRRLGILKIFFFWHLIKAFHNMLLFSLLKNDYSNIIVIWKVYNANM